MIRTVRRLGQMTIYQTEEAADSAYANVVNAGLPPTYANLLAADPTLPPVPPASVASLLVNGPATPTAAPAPAGTTTAPPAVTITSPSTWPWYYWAAAGGAALLLFASKGR